MQVLLFFYSQTFVFYFSKVYVKLSISYFYLKHFKDVLLVVLPTKLVLLELNKSSIIF
jgi:hypothetical protein